MNVDPEVGPARGSPAREGRVRRRLSRAWWVAGAYGVFAALWIYFSDQALALVAPDHGQFVRWSVYKGFVFVAVTTVLLLFLMQRAFGAIETGYAALQEQRIEIERLTRLYAALTEVNQAIVMMPNREALWAKICQVLVEHGGFHMAWIGWHDPATHRLVPVAVWGDDSDYVKSIEIYTDDRPEGRGPSGAAFREGRPEICNDLQNDPVMQPWRAEFLRRGFGASAAFPIRSEGRVQGTLNVYADQSDFFHDQEVSLLTKAAGNISFGLDNFVRHEERRQAEQKLQQEYEFSEAMLNSLPGVLYLYDQQGRFLRWNDNFSRVTGYTGAEIAPMSPLDFFAGADRELIAARIADVFARGESSAEAGLVAKDGRVTPYYLTGVATRFRDRTCLVGIGIDISARKRTEAAWRELNETLEARVADRTVALQAAVVRAESADRIKSAFLATMSHELRTPLNSIIGFTGIVLQGLAGPLNSEQAKQLGMVRNSARHLLHLINDVLDISKIEADQLEVVAEPFDLPESLGRVTASIRPVAEKKGLELVTSYAPDVGLMVGDQRRVEQIVLNLLNNAIKFTDRGRVALAVDVVPDFRSASATAPQPAIRLRVTDTGIGIKSADLASLFQPFRQIDTGLSRQHEGTGLGLAISRRLAILMHGEVSVTSEWTRGSEFTVIIPRQPSLA